MITCYSYCLCSSQAHYRTTACLRTVPTCILVVLSSTYPPSLRHVHQFQWHIWHIIRQECIDFDCLFAETPWGKYIRRPTLAVFCRCFFRRSGWLRMMPSLSSWLFPKSWSWTVPSSGWVVNLLKFSHHLQVCFRHWLEKTHTHSVHSFRKHRATDWQLLQSSLAIDR